MANCSPAVGRHGGSEVVTVERVVDLLDELAHQVAAARDAAWIVGALDAMATDGEPLIGYHADDSLPVLHRAFARLHRQVLSRLQDGASPADLYDRITAMRQPSSL